MGLLAASPLDGNAATHTVAKPNANPNLLIIKPVPIVGERLDSGAAFSEWLFRLPCSTVTSTGHLPGGDRHDRLPTSTDPQPAQRAHLAGATSL